MNGRIHDDEVDTSEPVVRALLAAQQPAWADHDLVLLGGTGTSNALWRVDADGTPTGVVRLPRTPGAEQSIRTEHALLPFLARTDLPLRVPALSHAGEPTSDFPLRWAATDWIAGTDAWAARAQVDAAGPAMASAIAQAVRAISAIDGAPVAARKPGRRGGPLEPLLAVLDRWLGDPDLSAAERLPIGPIRRLAAEAAELIGEPVPTVFLHGDLIPGNLLVAGSRISAVLDWGGAGLGDPADDLVAAWAVLDTPARSVFRTDLDVDDATWIRARTFALEQAVGGVLYYGPRRHPLGDVMARTLDRIVAEA